MRIAGTVGESIVDGPGFRFTVFTQGCSHRCPGCHNPHTHVPEGGKEIDVEELTSQLLANPLLDGLTLSGGEPFEQAEDCLSLAKAAHAAGLNVWSYSGYTFDQLLHGSAAQQALLQEIDVLVDGQYLQEQRSLTLLWRGSENQRVLDVAKSLVAGEAISYQA